jgi:hypothetical protein
MMGWAVIAIGPDTPPGVTSMIGLESIGKMLLVFGGVVLLVGLLFVIMGRVPYIGRLPGDMFFQKGNFSFYFPLVTSILVSIALTIILNLVFRVFR